MIIMKQLGNANRIIAKESALIFIGIMIKNKDVFLDKTHTLS